jgi:hypothetical protein
MFLHSQTVQKVRLICINALIVVHSDFILKELTDAINDLALSVLPNDIEELQYAMLLPRLSPLKSIFHLFSTIHLTLGSPLFLRSFSSEFYRFALLLGNSFRSRYKEVWSGSLRFDKRTATSYVQGVIVILLLITHMCMNLFQDDPLFVQATKKASKVIVNTDVDSNLNVVEFYAAYCETYLQVVELQFTLSDATRGITVISPHSRDS